MYYICRKICKVLKYLWFSHSHFSFCGTPTLCRFTCHICHLVDPFAEGSTRCGRPCSSHSHFSWRGIGAPTPTLQQVDMSYLSHVRWFDTFATLTPTPISPAASHPPSLFSRLTCHICPMSDGFESKLLVHLQKDLQSSAIYMCG